MDSTSFFASLMKKTILEKYLKLYILNINFAEFHTARYIGQITSPFISKF